QAALELECGLIHHQARADVADVLHGNQSVGLEGAAGGDEVDDDVGQSDQGSELHRTIQLDEVDVHALAGEVFARGVDVLGGDADSCALFHRNRLIVAFAHDAHHATAGNLHVEWLIQAVAAVFVEHILAGDAEGGGAVLDVGEDVAGAHDDEPHVGAV